MHIFLPVLVQGFSVCVWSSVASLTVRKATWLNAFYNYSHAPVELATAMVLSLAAPSLVRAAASLATPPPRRVASLVRAMASPPALGNSRRRLQNVPGEFFVGENDAA